MPYVSQAEWHESLKINGQTSRIKYLYQSYYLFAFHYIVLSIDFDI